MSDLKPTRPILRYHGGKWLLAPWIISHFPPHRIYVEPFGGAASVLLRKSRSYAEVYNDLDGEIVNLFRVCRECGEDLRRALYLTPYSREEYNGAYLPTDDSIEQARRLVIRSFMGHGGNSHSKKTGFRYFSMRRGTTPTHDWTTYPDALTAIIERLQGVTIENRDAREIIMIHDTSETLHYLDPPYLAETRDTGRDYQHEMTDDDHRALAETARALQGMVIISGYSCPLYDELYGDWQTSKRRSFADGAREREEVLWISPNAAQRYGKLFERRPEG